MSDTLHDLHADFSRRAIVATAEQGWQSSPSGTVWRKPLYREGGEFGPVTSVVRYAPGGAFRAHPHPEGEEILVLSGVFSDDSGDFPAGSWMFNPEGFSHAPRSAQGCDLLVRLRQYPGAQRRRRLIDTAAEPWRAGRVSGLSLKPLYDETGYPEYVCLLRLEAGAQLPPQRFEGGAEYFVLEGSLCDDAGEYGAGAWLRLPAGAEQAPYSPAGCIAYLRLGQRSGGVFEAHRENGTA
ncbi:MAG: cupin domain-containing protein [Acidihalobacter sp.]|jgi:anti-sigma factor ChrR (cupin superfamily)